MRTATLSNIAACVPSSVRSILMWATVLSLPLSGACGAAAAKTTACDGLVYKEFGLTRAEYLPCAGEIMATLDLQATHIENMLSGDEKALSDARATLRELRSLMKKAGWRDLLERWDDRALTSLNVDIWNAFNQHEACIMVASQLFGRAPLGDERNREPARSQCKAYRGAYQNAKSDYRRLL